MKEPVTALAIRNLFSINLKRLRNTKNMSQFDLAVSSGLAQNYINDIEHKKKWPSDKTIAKLVKALDAEPYLFFAPATNISIANVDLFVDDLSDTIISVVKDRCSRYIIGGDKKDEQTE